MFYKCACVWGQYECMLHAKIACENCIPSFKHQTNIQSTDTTANFKNMQHLTSKSCPEPSTHDCCCTSGFGERHYVLNTVCFSWNKGCMCDYHGLLIYIKKDWIKLFYPWPRKANGILFSQADPTNVSSAHQRATCKQTTELWKQTRIILKKCMYILI